jgi:hypothetical protein
MLLNTQQAQRELFNRYRTWENGYVRVSNAPFGCNQIKYRTANLLKEQWAPNASANGWSQSFTTGWESKDNIIRWVNRSCSGKNVVDFHARWFDPQNKTYVTFLWHFEIN